MTGTKSPCSQDSVRPFVQDPSRHWEATAESLNTHLQPVAGEVRRERHSVWGNLSGSCGISPSCHSKKGREKGGKGSYFPTGQMWAMWEGAKSSHLEKDTAQEDGLEGQSDPAKKGTAET